MKIPHKPTLAELIDVLQKEELVVAHTYLSLIRGCSTETNRKSSSKKSDKMRRHKFLDDHIFRDYLEKMKVKPDNYDENPRFYEEFNKNKILRDFADGMPSSCDSESDFSDYENFADKQG